MVCAEIRIRSARAANSLTLANHGCAAVHPHHGIARARAKIGLANLVYNMKRLIFLRKVAMA